MLTRRARVRTQRTGPAGRRPVQQPYHAAKSLSPLPKGLKMLEFDTLSKDNIDTRTRVVELSGGPQPSPHFFLYSSQWLSALRAFR